MSETQDALEDSELIPYETLFASRYTPGSVAWGIVRSPVALVTGDNPFDNERPASDYFIEINGDLLKEFFSFKKSFNDLDHKSRVDVIKKIKNSGLVQLVEEIGGIREFAQKRFSSISTLRSSAANINDPARDTAWLNQLALVRNYFAKDPIALSIVYSYFPNLSNLFITALAATADYGYTEEDALNNVDKIIEQMFRSFGVDENNNPVFKPVWAIKNFTTAQRIERAIKRIGTPANIVPKNPDIFHLRLGAANFYVPPVSISINTGFKTGSLTGGAIRQKSSPKFNSGHRETTINLRLYFPNYEEIWGLTIDDGSNVNVNSDFKINFKNPEDQEKIDKFLSSLRGLVAAFKYSPILPIRNHYINSVHGITGVALSSMNISTIPDYPFALVVDIELLNFNHKPFLPMVSDFNQAVHWGKYRQYMGRAAGSMYNYVSENFLLEGPDNEEAESKQPNSDNTNPFRPWEGHSGGSSVDDSSDSPTNQPYDYKTEILTTNVYNQWQDGKNLTLYVPAQVQSKIYTPDISSFRTAQEVALTDVGRNFWNGILNFVGIDANESADYHRTLDEVTETARNTNIAPSLKKRARTIVDVALAGSNSSDIKDKVYEILAIEYIATENITNKEVISYLRNPKPASELQVPGSAQNVDEIVAVKQKLYFAAKEPKGALLVSINSETDRLYRKRKRSAPPPEEEKEKDSEWQLIKAEVQKKYVDAFNVSLYERFFSNADIAKILEAARDKFGGYSFREWDVPMMMVKLDEKSIVINSVNVTIANNLAKLQLQMQEEPTYQHIGARDSFVNISMTVFGEKELIKLKKTFDFLSGLARLERAAGVIGFMGIKNIITALSGIKYVMPLSYNVDTIPNFPHVYSVQLSLVDFDVYQQKRERLSSDQQRKFVEEFKNKRNPFLRLKQNWSVFNAYPDMPLMLKDEQGTVVGTLDPDFYFRSFEMYDNDIVKSLIEPDQFQLTNNIGINNSDLNEYQKSLANQVKDLLITSNGSIEKAKDFLINESNLKPSVAMMVFRSAVFDKYNDTQLEFDALSNNGNLTNKYPTIWQDFVDVLVDEFDNIHVFSDLKFETRYGQLKIGDLVSGSKDDVEAFNNLVNSSQYDIENNKLPSIDPDEMDFVSVIHYIPSAQSNALGKIPALMQTPDGGFVFGYSDELDGRFYIAPDSLNLTKDSNGKIVLQGAVTAPISDTSSPDKDPQDSHTGIDTAQSVDKYMKPYTDNSTDKIQAVSTAGSYKSVAKHWEKMMMDTQYRDISGRMLRAFPTYMLWLIDEGGYFAGVKLFDNFYGLQSVIDFSIVQSEDILGDTLMLRVSNAYSKLSKPELTLTDIVDTTIVDSNNPNLTSGTAAIIDVLLNTSRNFTRHFDSQYITEIENVRLKPGVRVHLRGGYGSNPNALQTLFNGVITSVDYGEILTITAQSDAIELSPIINSTNKKGDSGKIDGGINTGLWMSEPRDLMIRLLSMGTSRTKEAFAHATRGTVFSENKFGIRHFGSILYEPLTEAEQNKATDFRNAVSNSLNAVANNPITGSIGLAWNSTANVITGTPGTVASGLGLNNGFTGLESAGGSVRTPIIPMMRTLWSNLSTQRDLEIFKRNIYPGNGLGIAQFLGGDIDDGWANLMSVDEQKLNNAKFGYLDRLTDSSWSRLIEDQQSGSNSDASNVIDRLTSGNVLVNQNEGSGFGKFLGGALVSGMAGYGLTGGLAGAGVKKIVTKYTPAGFLGAKLANTLGGRGMTSVFKTMGIVSDLDDDIYDEVSFRAQTYMRSVWDMFQLCARLLPNYIVAIRPFEDRSTIFYGKPHWVYTSGVVPVSTGFVNDNKAREDQVTIPAFLSPDGELSALLSSINKESNPVADSSAYAALSESSLSSTMSKFAEDSLTFQNVFSAGKSLRGKVINFGDRNRNKYYDNGEIKSILPANVGFVQIGFHLPFKDKTINQSEVESNIQEDHKQVNFLPARYRYPFFTNRASGTLPSLDFSRILNLDNVYDLKDRASNLVDVMKTENSLFKKKDGSIKLASIDVEGDLSLNLNFDFASRVSIFDSVVNPIDEAAFDPSGINIKDKISPSADIVVQMPLPLIGLDDVQKSSDGKYEFNDNFKDIFADLDDAYNRQIESKELGLNFSEWGMPESADHEQFYIAMRWPYDPVKTRIEKYNIKSEENIQNESLSKFKKAYGLENFELVGTPEDYKKRKVLVYNPTTRQAVVCAPAYFLWSDSDVSSGADLIDQSVGKLSAIVSPDAAFFLGLMFNEDQELLSPFDESYDINFLDLPPFKGAPNQSCMFTFVDDSVPLGVVTSKYNPARSFYSKTASKPNGWLIGFGRYTVNESYTGDGALDPNLNSNVPLFSVIDGTYQSGITNPRQFESYSGIKADYYKYNSNIRLLTADEYMEASSGLGNYSEYFNVIKDPARISGDSNELNEQRLIDIRKNEEATLKANKDKLLSTSVERLNFSLVFNEIDPVSVIARGFYDEDFDKGVKVIAGNGRTKDEAQWIWDQFRWGYHTYNGVKDIFFQMYGMDPDDNDTSTINPIIAILNQTNKSGTIEEFGSGNSEYLEFNSLLGADWIQNGASADTTNRKQALSTAINEYIDRGFDGVNEENKPKFNADLGLVDIFNAAIGRKVSFIRDSIKSHINSISSVQPNNVIPSTSSGDSSQNTTPTNESTAQGQTENQDSAQYPMPSTTTSPGAGGNAPFSGSTIDKLTDEYLKDIQTPKQLFLLLVGLFRQKLWEDPYSRAWLVLRPDRKRFIAGGRFNGDSESDAWEFGPVHKIWQAFIDYNSTYAKDSNKFRKLLEANAKEGSSATNVVTGAWSDTKNFWDKNIGPMFTAFSTALSSLTNMFRMSMAQMGYGLSQIDNFARQANILNKAYNDSIYYSLGREGTLLRAVDNPFTREYAEPVVEVREPFQRIHYLSSFSHILSNRVQENLSGVATQITAVSDGQYPVTVALDKAAPAERQVEKTVETGIYFDNVRGSGLFGVFHPVLHPMQTLRGIIKSASGEPDELTARRIALAHLKESLKDIYQGEIVLIGNPDIRPHDLVYLADVYERMYGIFEVEQVVHHFTPEMGFVTSITPNAFVTVNDPARWFLSSWISSRFSMQNIRNDTRMLMSSASGNNLINSQGQVSVDTLAESLSTQMVGGLMYTHGHSALVKDIMANVAADALPDISSQIKQKIKDQTGRVDGSVGAAIGAAVAGPLLTTASAAVGFLIGGPVGAGVGAGLGAAVGDLAWSAWKWTRDNVLDQHGCYIQYLNRNGQPMDAGLSFNQGMVVGRYHSKKILPGILGTRMNARTPEGNAYIRSDDLLKSLGWREKEISDLVRYISLENAIVNSQVLKYSGIGPEKTGLNQFFKVIGLVTRVVDGDTFDVIDVLKDLNGNGDISDEQPIRIRFEGLNTAELAQININAALNINPDFTPENDSQAIFNPETPSGRALNFTAEAVTGRLVVLRIAVKSGETTIFTEDDLDAGGAKNRPEYYSVAYKNESYADSDDRYMSTIFYKTDEQVYNSILQNVRSIFLQNISNLKINKDFVKEDSKKKFYVNSVIYKKFDNLYKVINSLQTLPNYFVSTGSGDPLNIMTAEDKKMYSTIVSMFILDKIYDKASQWPLVAWDEYYSDGSPITLNWELVVNGLASVYTKGLLYTDTGSQPTIEEELGIGTRID